MRAAGKKLYGGDVVRLYQKIRLDQLADGLHFALIGGHRQGRIDDFFAAQCEAFGNLEHDIVTKRLALRADDFAQTNPINRRFVGDACVEIHPMVGRPVVEDRTQRQG